MSEVALILGPVLLLREALADVPEDQMTCLGALDAAAADVLVSAWRESDGRQRLALVLTDEQGHRLGHTEIRHFRAAEASTPTSWQGQA